MNPLEIEAGRARRSLLARERRAQREMVRSYGEALRRLRAEYAAIERQIAAAQTAGIPGSRLIARGERLDTRIRQVSDELYRYMTHAAPILTRLQRDHVQAAVGDAHSLIGAALGPGPAFEFRPPPFTVAEQIIGFAGDGSPLGDLLHEVAGAVIRQARDDLVTGVIIGRHPRVIARRFAATTGETLSRSLLIARTEGIRAYRLATRDTLAANPGVVTGWTWLAAYDTRTCPACWAMSGTVHGPDETLNSHPGCRCSMVPRTASWAELGFPDVPDSRPVIPLGESVFARLPASEQRQILGPAKHAAYVDGRIALNDLVRVTSSPRWGVGRTTASLQAALAHAA